MVLKCSAIFAPPNTPHVILHSCFFKSEINQNLSIHSAYNNVYQT
jgi:hypothetical protein